MKARQDIVLGRVRGAFGVKGWLRVESFTDPAENILEYARWRVKTRRGLSIFCPVQGQWHGPGLVVQLATEDGGLIADREAALSLMNAEICVSRKELPELNGEEIYWVDLIGMSVFSADERQLGQVAEVVDNPAHPILRISDGEQECLVPFVREEIVSKVDQDAQRIELTWAYDDAF